MKQKIIILVIYLSGCYIGFKEGINLMPDGISPDYKVTKGDAVFCAALAIFSWADVATMEIVRFIQWTDHSKYFNEPYKK